MARLETAKDSDKEKEIQNEFKLDIIFILFSTLSLILAALPLPGYIHPDEFFQSVEVTAGMASINVHVSSLSLV